MEMIFCTVLNVLFLLLLFDKREGEKLSLEIFAASCKKIEIALTLEENIKLPLI